MSRRHILIQDILKSQLEYSLSTSIVHADESLGDIGADEVDVMDLLDYIDEEFDVEIADEEVTMDTTIEDLAEMIVDRSAK